jgi:hypothetical protein
VDSAAEMRVSGNAVHVDEQKVFFGSWGGRRFGFVAVAAVAVIVAALLVVRPNGTGSAAAEYRHVGDGTEIAAIDFLDGRDVGLRDVVKSVAASNSIDLGEATMRDLYEDDRATVFALLSSTAVCLLDSNGVDVTSVCEDAVVVAEHGLVLAHFTLDAREVVAVDVAAVAPDWATNLVLGEAAQAPVSAGGFYRLAMSEAQTDALGYLAWVDDEVGRSVPLGLELPSDVGEM